MPLENETIGMDFNDAVAWVKDRFVAVLDDDWPDNEDLCWVTLIDGGHSPRTVAAIMRCDR